MDYPKIPEPPYAGGCLCGAVRYSLNAKPVAVNACYCTDCQKLTGATNLLMIMADSAAFKHEQGKVDRYRKTADSGRQTDIARCETCGVRLWHEPLSAPEFILVAAGTLDDARWAVPVSHIWTSSALPLTNIPADAVYTCAVQPAARQEMIDAFQRVHGK